MPDLGIALPAGHAVAFLAERRERRERPASPARPERRECRELPGPTDAIQ